MRAMNIASRVDRDTNPKRQRGGFLADASGWCAIRRAGQARRLNDKVIARFLGLPHSH